MFTTIYKVIKSVAPSSTETHFVNMTRKKTELDRLLGHRGFGSVPTHLVEQYNYSSLCPLLYGNAL